MVEGDRAGHLAEPGARGAALRVEAVPEPQRPLESLPCQLVGRVAVAGEPAEVAVDVVEVALGSLGEGHLAPHTPPPGMGSHSTRRLRVPRAMSRAVMSRGLSPGHDCFGLVWRYVQRACSSRSLRISSAFGPFFSTPGTSRYALRC